MPKSDNPSTVAGLPRRRFLQVFGGGAAAVVALPWLAACGSSSSSSGGSSSAAASSGGASSAASGGGFGTVTQDTVKTLLGLDKLDAKTLGAGTTEKIAAP